MVSDSLREQALKLYELRQAAKAGDAEAQYRLGEICETGDELHDQNLCEALLWYRQAAKQAQPTALYRLGCLALLGRGVEADATRATDWFQAAIPGLRALACTDDADAQCRLGWLYSQGLGVSADQDMALRWLQQSASQQHPDALYQLGLLSLKQGQSETAQRHFLAAAAQDHIHARYQLARQFAQYGNADAALNACQQVLAQANANQLRLLQQVQTLLQSLTTDNADRQMLLDICTARLAESGAANTGSPLDFNEDFLCAYQAIVYGDQTVFITGRAGTGKSTLLRYARKYTHKQIAVLAPTGVAALNVDGVTIHSFFRLPPRPIHPDEVEVVSRKRQRLYRQLDAIIIDEVSMVRADLIDVIDRFLRINGRDSEKPFGGVQMIFIGDLYQLPPVQKETMDDGWFKRTYHGPYFFHAQVFSQLPLQVIELQRIYRQSDRSFIALLNRIRINNLMPADIRTLNMRYRPDYTVEGNEFVITLTTTNAGAERINDVRLAQLAGESRCYMAEISGVFDEYQAPADNELKLKIGAQIMFVRNDTQLERWVNGTLGRVAALSDQDVVVIEMSDGHTHEVEPVTWEVQRYHFNETENKIETEVTGSFKQYPLKLAWAMTIHKSQGKTFDRVVLDIGRGAFAHGQLYVALSRCRTLGGIILKTPVRRQDVIVDEQVKAFFARL